MTPLRKVVFGIFLLLLVGLSGWLFATRGDADDVQTDLAQARSQVARVHLAPALKDFIVRLVMATRPGGAVAEWVEHPVSPRGTLALAAGVRSLARRVPQLAGADLDDDMARILTEEHRAGAFSCVMHCFTSGAALAQTALDLGFYLSMSGIAAFPRSADLRAIFATAPVDRILVETDSPYLAPPPHRGKRNEPAYVAKTAALVAEVFGMDYPQFAAQTSANFDRLFSKAAA